MKLYNVSDKLNKRIQEIYELSLSKKLDPFTVEFKMCDQKAINIFATFGGFPERYSHWKFGMDYQKQKSMSDYGLGRIYEMVLNTKPSYAYLLDSNTDMETDLVVAHVYGHSDFFKNNYYFSATDRNMLDKMSRHKQIVNKYTSLHGKETVEKFIDRVLSLENLISSKDMLELNKIEYNTDSNELNKIKYPHADVLGFLEKFAPVKDWQRDIITVIKDEAYYFLPQRMTKIMNEGWATYWHTEMMQETLCEDSEIFNFAKVNSSVLAINNQLNPYKLGYDLFKFIKKHEDEGKYSDEYRSCRDYDEKKNWNKKTNKGLEKIFEIRESHNDWSFIYHYLTEEFLEEYPMHFYKKDRRGKKIKTQEFKAIKNHLLSMLTNFGNPLIKVVDSNFDNASELLLEHTHQGTDLEYKYIKAVMENLKYIWDRPVNLRTIKDDQVVRYRFDKDLTEYKD